MNTADVPDSTPPPDAGRRDFLLKAATISLGTASVLPPVAAAVAVALDPLRRLSKDSTFVHVTTLDALPEDGVPRKFTVFSDRVDAWNKYPKAPIGAIYLRRTSPTAIHALHTSCPHAGCLVDYIPSGNHFYCPCHNSSFAVDGAIDNPSSPAARRLDDLEVEIRNEKEVWVKFQNFRAGTPEKIHV